jgi:hypothetical protein
MNAVRIEPSAPTKCMLANKSPSLLADTWVQLAFPESILPHRGQLGYENAAEYFRYDPAEIPGSLPQWRVTVDQD